MRNILCQLPDPNEFPEKLYFHFKGKIVVCFIILLSGFLGLAHYLVGISQLWTLVILSSFLIYIAIPTKWYMRNIYRFFISSFVGTLSTSLVFFYIGWLFFISIGFKITTSILVLSTIIIYIFIFSIELYQFRNKVDVYKQLIKKSIIDIDKKQSVFSFDLWLSSLKISSANLGSGISMYTLLILTVPVLIIGFFGGNPIISARIILDSNQDYLAYLVICLVCIALSIFLIAIVVEELLKIIALVQLNNNS